MPQQAIPLSLGIVIETQSNATDNLKTMKTGYKSFRIIKDLMGVIGSVASVVVAVIAILIQQQIHEDSQAQREMSRAITLYKELVQSEEWQSISKATVKYEEIYSNKSEGRDIDLKMVKAWKRYFERDSTPSLVGMRQDIIPTLRKVEIIAECGNFSDVNFDREGNLMVKDQSSSYSFRDGMFNPKENKMCDRYTIVHLFGEIFETFYFTFRPLLYCDGYLGDFKRNRRKLEKIVAGHIHYENPEKPTFLSRAAYKTSPIYLFDKDGSSNKRGVVFEFATRRERNENGLCAPIGEMVGKP